MANLLPNLESMDDVLARLKRRKDMRHDVYIKDAEDMGFRWREAGVGIPDGGFWMKIDGKEMPLSDSGEKTAAERIQQKKSGWFRRFGDPNFFPKSFRNYNHSTGFLVRHNGYEVQAVLPESYVVYDAYDFLYERIIPALQDNFGEVRGIAAQDDGDGEKGAYRIVVGDNLLLNMNADDPYGQFMMFQLLTSEVDMIETKSWLGMYRPADSSSSIRGQTQCKWKHRRGGEAFFNRMGTAIANTSHYSEQFKHLMSGLIQLPLPINGEGLPMDPLDILSLLYHGKMLNKGHFDACKPYTNQMTVDGRKISTQYDLFNVFTRGAQDILSMEHRAKAEDQSLKLFGEAGGLLEMLKRAAENTPDELAI